MNTLPDPFASSAYAVATQTMSRTLRQLMPKLYMALAINDISRATRMTVLASDCHAGIGPAYRHTLGVYPVVHRRPTALHLK